MSSLNETKSRAPAKTNTSQDHTGAGRSSDAQTAQTQAEKFAATAREHGTDQDEEAFKGVLRKLGKAKDRHG